MIESALTNHPDINGPRISTGEMFKITTGSQLPQPSTHNTEKIVFSPHQMTKHVKEQLYISNIALLARIMVIIEEFPRTSIFCFNSLSNRILISSRPEQGVVKFLDANSPNPQCLGVITRYGGGYKWTPRGLIH